MLPIQIFHWAQRPQEDFQQIAASAIIVLLVVMFILNALALFLRVRLPATSSGRGASVLTQAIADPAVPPIRRAPTVHLDAVASPSAELPRDLGEPAVELRDVTCYYGTFRAVRERQPGRRRRSRSRR